MSDQDDLRQQIQIFTSLVKTLQDRPDAIETSRKYLSWLQAVVGMGIIVIGLGINWGITTTKIGILEANIESSQEHISKLENDIHALQLSQARDDQLLILIQSTLKEVRDDIKTLTGAKK